MEKKKNRTLIKDLKGREKEKKEYKEYNLV